jgi:hypothetical protein
MWNKGMTRLRMAAHTRTAGLVVGLCLASALPARADAVTTWNDITVKSVAIGRPGPVGYLDIALVQAAVHDAVQAFEKRFEPYYATIDNASGAPAAAVAAAAHGVLVGIYPGQKVALDGELLTFLTANGLVGDAGLAVGQQAAAALVTQYRAIPSPAPTFGGSDAPGEWRPTPSFIGSPPTPPSFALMATPYLATTTPYALLRPSQFRPQAPPPLTSQQYAREYAEVKAMGARFSSARSAAQTDLAYFWSLNFVTQWNQALRAIADAHLTSLGDSARLFALATMATADALITCWDTKIHYNYWRPITAIRLGDTDGNPNTEPDANWEPLINTPNYPDYSSGANNVTAAMVTTLQQFFGTDDFTFTVTTNAAAAVIKSRTYARFSEAADQVVDARILLGFHFRSADEEARQQGARVAHWVFQKFLRPSH